LASWRLHGGSLTSHSGPWMRRRQGMDEALESVTSEPLVPLGGSIHQATSDRRAVPADRSFPAGGRSELRFNTLIRDSDVLAKLSLHVPDMTVVGHIE